MRKRFLSALLALCMVLTLLPGTALAGNVGETQLTDSTEKQCYDELETFIQKVANGEETSSVFTKTGTAIINDQDDYNAMNAEINALLTGYKKAASYLLIDCPAEFYWYDKTVGMESSGSAGTVSIPSQSPVTYTITVTFAVSEDYAATGEANTLDSTKVERAKTAIAAAKKIVDDNASKSDYEKLKAYKDAICEAVTYNTEAASNKTTPYGDPWQMISVFDNDENTNVVCEGYSKAFQYLCDQTTTFEGDVTCYTVTGTMAGGTGAGEHMWNVVVMNGETYLVDVTNSDDGSAGQDGELFLAGTSNVTEDTLRYEYEDEDGNKTEETVTVPKQTFTIGANNTITYTWDKDSLDLYDGMPKVSAMSQYSFYDNPLLGTVKIAPTTATETVTVGTELKATYTAPANAENAPKAEDLSYVWWVDGNAKSTATYETYTVVTTDIPKDIWVEVRAAGYDGSLRSNTITPTAILARIVVAGDSNSITLTPGDSFALNAKVMADVTEVENAVITYSVKEGSASSIRVSDNGVVNVSNDASVGDTATITLSADLTGYSIQPVNVTVTVKDLDDQKVSFTSDHPTSVEIGHAKFTVTATSEQGGEISYSSSNEDVATVDAKTGEVTIVGVGTTTITATAAPVEDYGTGTAEFTLTVAKKKITVTVTLTKDETYTFDTGIFAYPEVDVKYKDENEVEHKLNFDQYSLSFKDGYDGTSAGKQVIVVSPAASADYTFDEKEVEFTIGEAELTLTAKDIPLWIDQVVQDEDGNITVEIEGTATIVDRDGKDVDIKGTWSFVEGTTLDTSKDNKSTVSVRFTPDEPKNFKTPEDLKIDVTVSPITLGDANSAIDKAVNNFVDSLKDTSVRAVELLDTLVDWFFTNFKSASSLKRTDFRLVIDGKEYTMDDLENGDVMVYADSVIQLASGSSDVDKFFEDLDISLDKIEIKIPDSVDTKPVDVDDETYHISVIRGENGDVIVGTRYAEEGERVTVSVYPDDGYELDELTVTNSRGRSITLRELGDGKYSFTMPDTRVTVEATFVKEAGSSTTDIAPIPGTNHTTQRPDDEIFTGLGTPGISGIVLNPSPMPFSDVRYTDWFCESVEYMWKHYLMSGVSDSSFAPNLTTSRAMIWTVLARMNNIRTDLNPGYNWYENGMQWAMSQGITDGTNALADITREQLATMLWRNAGSPSSGGDLSSFSDAGSVSAYAQTAIRWAVSTGVMNGQNGLLNPQGTATRAQVAAMVARYGNKVA